MKPKMLKVNCSFCGREMECPEDMKNSEKHACFECFRSRKDKFIEEGIEKVHVDIPMEKMDEVMPDLIIGRIMETVFPEVRKEEKSKLKEMTKKEAAEYMFSAGASITLDSMMRMNKKGQKLIKKEQKG